MKKSIGAFPLVFPAPVFLIGTFDTAGKPNIMCASWAGICCSNPPCVYVSLREATYTFGSIMARKAFTISIPSEKHVKEADYCGIVSGRSVDKFQACGLTPVHSEVVDAPYVEEFPFVLECSLYKTLPLGLHTQFVGKVEDIKVDEGALAEAGPDIARIQPFSFNPADRGYYATGGFLGKAFSIGKK